MQPLLEDIQYLFDQRLRGDLSASELSEFNQRLANEPAFAQQWNEFQMLSAGLSRQFAAETSAETVDLRRRIAQAASELDAEGFFSKKQTQAPSAKIVHMSPMRRYLALAAAIVMILAAVWFFNTPSPSGEQMFASNFQVEQKQLASSLDELEKYSLGEADAESRQALAKALTLVEKQQFAEAIPLLKNWLKNPLSETPSAPADRATARFYLAQSLMATGNTSEEPRGLLETLLNDPAFSAPEDARWYLALCHLKNKQLETARPLLQTVAGSPSSHAPEATKLLQQID